MAEQWRDASPHLDALGGVYEPWEEALVKVWDLRRSLAAEPAVLCNMM